MSALAEGTVRVMQARRGGRVAADAVRLASGRWVVTDARTGSQHWQDDARGVRAALRRRGAVTADTVDDDWDYYAEGDVR